MAFGSHKDFWSLQDWLVFQKRSDQGTKNVYTHKHQHIRRHHVDLSPIGQNDLLTPINIWLLPSAETFDSFGSVSSDSAAVADIRPAPFGSNDYITNHDQVIFLVQ